MKGVLFDFWGTLVENGVFPSPVSQVKYFLRLRDIRFHDYIVRFEKVFMTSKLSSLTEGFEKVCAEFNVSPPSWVIDKMVGMWNKNRLLARPFPETEEVLGRLSAEYKLGLISNTDAFSIEPLLEKFSLSKYFSAVTLSCNEGYLKIDKELYHKNLKLLGLKPEDVVMVGDSMESDVRSAENAGIRAILVDRRDKREYKNRITSLNELPDALKKIKD